tara:strand:- start:36 stop:668 length:633 start_codon:yes stop_codon:yes gene_type:complete
MKLTEKQKICRKKYYYENRKRLLEGKKEYWEKNKKILLERHKKWVIKNRKHYLDYLKNYRAKNKKKIIQEKKEYYLKNRNKIIVNAVEYSRKKLKTDPLFRLIENYRSRTRSALKGIDKSEPTLKLLGIPNNDFFRNFMEEQFQEGMTWKNYGHNGWHIDHIIPCASFDFSDPEQQKKCFHYTNLQPLWAHDNMSKGNKIISGDLTSPKT